MRLKFVFAVLCFVLFVSSAIWGAEARTRTFSVPPETDFTISMELRENDRVYLGFSVIGETTNTICFYIIDPDEETTYLYPETGHESFSFFTTEAGTYTLHFNNTESAESKTVTLNYDVEHYMFGVPQEMFLTVVIVIICILAVAAFILTGKRSY